MNSYGDPNSARGRAQVPGTGYDYPASPPVGRASVPNSGGYTYDDEPSVPGRTVGRAAVRPVVPVSPAEPAGPYGPGDPYGPGGPYEPGGPYGPGGAGPGGPYRPQRLAAARNPRRKRKRRSWMLAAFAVFIMLAGAAVVGGTWYYDEVPKVTDFDVPEATTILFADGKTQLAKLGEVNRTIVPIGEIPVDVQHAVVSAEDRNFYVHGGIDIQGIARAAWNNVTGGETQGASTITQQYARNVADLSGITYARKIREAVIANKMEQDLKKEDILYHYLNAIYFGRGAHGIEAAALTFFGVSAKKLTVEQSAVLAAVIKQPEPRGNAKGFDPAYDLEAAKGRWGYVLDGMVEMKWLDPAKRAAMQYPKVNPYDPAKPSCAIDCGINQPTGNVINYVRDEMDKLGFKDWKEGGYQITTSINPTMQGALEKVIRRSIPGSELAGQPPNLMAAAVAIDPTTGKVLAYYGGENGTGTDYAGWNWEGGKKTGGHSPGSSFKIYTLAAGLKAEISMNTMWDATATKDGPFTISNAGRTAKCGKSCSLEESTRQSYNVPFYWLTKAIGPGKVLEAAAAAGIRHMWNDDGNEVVENAKSVAAAAGNFHYQLGYGQYGITVLDHANGAATFAARGVYSPAHFIVEVKKKDEKTGQWLTKAREKFAPKRVFDQNQVDDIVSVLSNYPTDRLSGNRQSGRKTGTWELNSKSSENGDAWNIGFTPQIATAVWVGNVKERLPIKFADDPKKLTVLSKVQGSNLPADIWKRFMDEAHKGQKTISFPERKNTGNDNHPAANGTSPTPSAQPGGPCPFPFLCPGPGPGNGGGGGGGPGGGGGGNNGPAAILPTPTPTLRAG